MMVSDGGSMKVPYVDLIKVGFEKSIYYVGSLVMDDEVLLGVLSMEGIDLVLIALPARSFRQPTPITFYHQRSLAENAMCRLDLLSL